MKINLLILLPFLLITVFTSAQSDTLNRTDANGEKIGWWKVYLDKDLGITQDLSKAKYYRYSYYKGKFDYYRMNNIGTKNSPVIAPPIVNSDGQIPPLDGEYRTNYKNGSPKYIITAENGKMTHYKEYRKNGNLSHTFNYTEQCGDNFLFYCIYFYEKDGTLKFKTTQRSPK